MRSITRLISIFLLLAMCSCKKDKAPSECFSNATTVRVINNVQATIKESNGNYFIIEQGSIDTKLNPCNLNPEFWINNLPVVITGEVKLTSRNSQPCCTDNFVITKIEK